MLARVPAGALAGLDLRATARSPSRERPRWTVSGTIAAAAGGYTAGRLAGEPKASTAAWHGLTSWAFTRLVVLYLLTTTVGSLVGGTLGAVSGAVGGLGRTATAATTAAPVLAQATDPFSGIEQSLRETSGGQDPAAFRAVRSAVTGDQVQAQDARERAAQAIARAQNFSVEEARTRVGQYEQQQYRQAAERAERPAATAADALHQIGEALTARDR